MLFARLQWVAHIANVLTIFVVTAFLNASTFPSQAYRVTKLALMAMLATAVQLALVGSRIQASLTLARAANLTPQRWSFVTRSALKRPTVPIILAIARPPNSKVTVHRAHLSIIA